MVRCESLGDHGTVRLNQDMVILPLAFIMFSVALQTDVKLPVFGGGRR